MAWQDYIAEIVSAPVVVGIGVLFGRIWAGRILAKDRARYQTAMESLLQDIRTKDNKELLVHRLQFEKEFAIYQELWASARQLAIACQGFNDIQIGPAKAKDELHQELVHAYGAFNDVVRSNEPFYSTEVYRVAEELREFVVSLCQVDQQVRRLEERSGGSQADIDKLCELDKKKSKILRAIPTVLPKLRDAIRDRVWSTNATGWDRLEEQQ